MVVTFIGGGNRMTRRKPLTCPQVTNKLMSTKVRDRRGPDHMVVGFTTTYAISAYHHWCCEFETWSGRGVQHYVIKFVSDCVEIVCKSYDIIGSAAILWPLTILEILVIICILMQNLCFRYEKKCSSFWAIVNLLFSSLIWQLYISNSYLKHKFCISMQIKNNKELY
jgi:hypothetical protein